MTLSNDAGRIDCPMCGSNLGAVRDSRPGSIMGAHSIKRRRFCPTCQKRHTTWELSEAFMEGLEGKIRREIVMRLLQEAKP